MKTIVLTGPDGTGKSTLCELIKKELKGKVVISSAWDTMGLLSKSNTENHLNSKDKIQDYLKKSDHQARLYFLFHAVSRSEQQAREAKPDYILFDGYWYKYAVAEMARGGDKNQILKTAELFLRPDLVLFLDIEPANALERKKNPSSYESGGAEKNRENEFLKFQSAMYNYWKELKTHFGWEVINSELDINQVKKQILEKIKELTRAE